MDKKYPCLCARKTNILYLCLRHSVPSSLRLCLSTVQVSTNHLKYHQETYPVHVLDVYQNLLSVRTLMDPNVSMQDFHICLDTC